MLTLLFIIIIFLITTTIIYLANQIRIGNRLIEIVRATGTNSVCVCVCVHDAWTAMGANKLGNSPKTVSSCAPFPHVSLGQRQAKDVCCIRRSVQARCPSPLFPLLLSYYSLLAAELCSLCTDKSHHRVSVCVQSVQSLLNMTVQSERRKNGVHSACLAAFTNKGSH